MITAIRPKFVAVTITSTDEVTIKARHPESARAAIAAKVTTTINGSCYFGDAITATRMRVMTPSVVVLVMTALLELEADTTITGTADSKMVGVTLTSV